MAYILTKGESLSKVKVDVMNVKHFKYFIHPVLVNIINICSQQETSLSSRFRNCTFVNTIQIESRPLHKPQLHWVINTSLLGPFLSLTQPSNSDYYGPSTHHRAYSQELKPQKFLGNNNPTASVVPFTHNAIFLGKIMHSAAGQPRQNLNTSFKCNLLKKQNQAIHNDEIIKTH